MFSEFIERPDTMADHGRYMYWSALLGKLSGRFFACECFAQDLHENVNMKLLVQNNWWSASCFCWFSGSSWMCTKSLCNLGIGQFYHIVQYSRCVKTSVIVQPYNCRWWCPHCHLIHYSSTDQKNNIICWTAPIQTPQLWVANCSTPSVVGINMQVL